MAEYHDLKTESSQTLICQNPWRCGGLKVHHKAVGQKIKSSCMQYLRLRSHNDLFQRHEIASHHLAPAVDGCNLRAPAAVGSDEDYLDQRQAVAVSGPSMAPKPQPPRSFFLVLQIRTAIDLRTLPSYAPLSTIPMRNLCDLRRSMPQSLSPFKFPAQTPMQCCKRLE